jgi:predicted transcriptional regulator of viral defense system
MSEADLLRAAAHQHGFFTAAQALAAGVSYRSLTDRCRRGVITRIEYGLYRLGSYAETPLDHLYALQVGVPSAVFSHETALELYGLSDVIAQSIHVIVPPDSGVKRRSGVTVHRSQLMAHEETTRNELRLTSLARTIADCARSGTDTTQLRAAALEGERLMLLNQSDLSRLSRTYPKIVTPRR